MYIKVLYNIKKTKKMCVGGGAIFEPKTHSMYFLKKRGRGGGGGARLGWIDERIDFL